MYLRKLWMFPSIPRLLASPPTPTTPWINVYFCHIQLTFEQQDLNCTGPFVHRFFSINMQSAFCIFWFHTCGFNQSQIENSIFLTCDWESGCCRLSMHWFTLFYIKSLNIHELWYLCGKWGAWNQFSRDTKE